MTRTDDSQNGFTLIEMLISITLLSLLMITLFSGVRFINSNGGRVEAVIAEAERLDLVRDLLARQMAALLPLAGGQAGGKMLFTGHSDRLAFPIARPPGQGPAGLMLAVFDIESAGGASRLLYREYPFRTGATIAVADQPSRTSLLARIDGAMSFSYQGPGAIWQQTWPEGTSLPRLVGLSAAGWPTLTARPRAGTVHP
jgi:general secretion pathway protein J